MNRPALSIRRLIFARFPSASRAGVFVPTEFTLHKFTLPTLAASLVLALLLFGLSGLSGLFGINASSAHADGRTKAFVGAGSGTSTIANPEECDSEGKCDMEFEGTFNAGEIGAGTVEFQFTDDWSAVTRHTNTCTKPVGSSSFVWRTEEGDGLIMNQTLGFICPSVPDSGIWRWSRVLRIDTGTGKFDGASGTVFVSGTRTPATGEETWTFEGNITFPKEQRDGCYKAYFIGDLIVIPPKGTPPLPSATLAFWLCADDVSLQWPNPREDYEIFNPVDE